jgi:hypothetical protein
VFGSGRIPGDKAATLPTYVGCQRVRGTGPVRWRFLAPGLPVAGSDWRSGEWDGPYAPASIFASMKPAPAPVPAPGQVEAPTMYRCSTGVR